jgi:hypothetical protein
MSVMIRVPVLAGLIVCTALAGAEEPSAAPEAKRSLPVPLKLQVLFSRYLGEKKVASAPYTLSLNAESPAGRPSRLRMGIQVPIRVDDKEAKGNVVYRDVGNNMDCWAEPLGGRFRVVCSFDQSALYSPEGEARASVGGRGGPGLDDVPVFRSFRADANVLLADGQSAQITSATDPVSGEVLRIDLTLSLVK